MEPADLLSTMTADDRERELLSTRTPLHRWPCFALLQHVENGDEELWSLRAGLLSACLCVRLPEERRRSFSDGHRRREEQLWQKLLGAAALVPAAVPSVEAGTGPSQPEQARATRRKALAAARRAYSRAATPPRAALPVAVRRQLLAGWEQAGRRCGICGGLLQAAEPAEIDHMLPVARGGSDEPANLRLAHAACNRLRGATYLAPDAVPDEIEMRFEAKHPSLHAALSCRICGARTTGFIDIEGLPSLRLCISHRDWDTVMALLAGFGAGGPRLAALGFPSPGR